MLTWRELREEMKKIPEALLDQPVQLMGTLASDPIALDFVIALDTVDSFCRCPDVEAETEFPSASTRSAKDNKHHPEDWVLLVDTNPFDEAGNMSYTLTDDGFVGDTDGKLYE